MRMECNSSSGTISFLYKNVGYNFDNYTEGYVSYFIISKNITF